MQFCNVADLQSSWFKMLPALPGLSLGELFRFLVAPKNAPREALGVTVAFIITSSLLIAALVFLIRKRPGRRRWLGVAWAGFGLLVSLLVASLHPVFESLGWTTVKLQKLGTSADWFNWIGLMVSAVIPGILLSAAMAITLYRCCMEQGRAKRVTVLVAVGISGFLAWVTYSLMRA